VKWALLCLLLTGCANCHPTFDLDADEEEVAPILGFQCDF
jgi:hypothetical protein